MVVNKTFTKTVGECPDNYAIFQISFCEGIVPHSLEKQEKIVYNVITNSYGKLECMRQVISADDIENLWLLFWEVKNEYERRQRDKKEQSANQAEGKEGEASQA